MAMTNVVFDGLTQLTAVDDASPGVGSKLVEVNMDVGGAYDVIGEGSTYFNSAGAANPPILSATGRSFVTMALAAIAGLGWVGLLRKNHRIYYNGGPDGAGFFDLKYITENYRSDVYQSVVDAFANKWPAVRQALVRAIDVDPPILANGDKMSDSPFYDAISTEFTSASPDVNDDRLYHRTIGPSNTNPACQTYILLIALQLYQQRHNPAITMFGATHAYYDLSWDADVIENPGSYVYLGGIYDHIKERSGFELKQNKPIHLPGNNAVMNWARGLKDRGMGGFIRPLLLDPNIEAARRKLLRTRKGQRGGKV